MRPRLCCNGQPFSSTRSNSKDFLLRIDANEPQIARVTTHKRIVETGLTEDILLESEWLLMSNLEQSIISLSKTSDSEIGINQTKLLKLLQKHRIQVQPTRIVPDFSC